MWESKVCSFRVFITFFISFVKITLPEPGGFRPLHTSPPVQRERCIIQLHTEDPLLHPNSSQEATGHAKQVMYFGDAHCNGESKCCLETFWRIPKHSPCPLHLPRSEKISLTPGTICLSALFPLCGSLFLECVFLPVSTVPISPPSVKHWVWGWLASFHVFIKRMHEILYIVKTQHDCSCLASSDYIEFICFATNPTSPPNHQDVLE